MRVRTAYSSVDVTSIRSLTLRDCTEYVAENESIAAYAMSISGLDVCEKHPPPHLRLARG
jgi:hypothetical protein